MKSFKNDFEDLQDLSDPPHPCPDPHGYKNDTLREPVLSARSKTGKTNVFKTDGSLMQAENIAECSL